VALKSALAMLMPCCRLERPAGLGSRTWVGEGLGWYAIDVAVLDQPLRQFRFPTDAAGHLSTEGLQGKYKSPMIKYKSN
jgi:hypothetical protein